MAYLAVKAKSGTSDIELRMGNEKVSAETAAWGKSDPAGRKRLSGGGGRGSGTDGRRQTQPEQPYKGGQTHEGALDEEAQVAEDGVRGEFADQFAAGEGRGVEQVVFDNIETCLADDIAEQVLAQFSTTGNDHIVAFEDSSGSVDGLYVSYFFRGWLGEVWICGRGGADVIYGRDG